MVALQGPLIHRLELETAASLADLTEFYGEALGLRIRDRTSDCLTIVAGQTELVFCRAKESGAAPFYHFAFNIPQNKIELARAWQLERTPLELPPPNLRDARLPDDIVHFRHWDAHSVFFWDPGGNFVEYIARHTMANGSAGDFSSRDILYASEIGLATDDTSALAQTLMESFDLDTYGSGSAAFHAVGDEQGLLIAMRRGRQMGWQNGRPIEPAKVDVEVSSIRQAKHVFAEYPYTVGATP